MPKSDSIQSKVGHIKKLRLFMNILIIVVSHETLSLKCNVYLVKVTLQSLGSIPKCMNIHVG